MFIFRVEHKRDICTDPYFGRDGESITGHGCQMFSRYNCLDPYSKYDKTPRFGGVGAPPRRIMEHERCAVTAEQFHRWIGMDWTTGTMDIALSDEWHIVAYGVEDNAYGVDWREDNDQIIFNPEFAVNLGSVALSEIDQLAYA